MNSSEYRTTAYFDSDVEARSAEQELDMRGFDVQRQSQSSHGETFWDSVKAFFGAGGSRAGGAADAASLTTGSTGYEEYGNGTMLTVSGSDAATVQAIVQRYNGRVSGGFGTPGTTMSSEAAARESRPAGTTTAGAVTGATMPGAVTGTTTGTTSGLGAHDNTLEDEITHSAAMGGLTTSSKLDGGDVEDPLT